MRSPRRRKTVQARLIGGVLKICIPSWMTEAEERRWVETMTQRFERRTATDRIDLSARAGRLAALYGLEAPASIRWVDNQESRWGSCTPRDQTIRLSSRLGREPDWVIDYVIVHELAHLTVAGHGPAFWALVGRYPLTERARGFLMARTMDAGEPDWSQDDLLPTGSEQGSVTAG